MSLIVQGAKPFQDIPDISLGKQIYNKLLEHQHLPEALVEASSGEAISYKRLLEETRQLARSLKRMGIVQNSVISICCENSLYFFHPVMAAMYLGAIIAPFNPNYTTNELLHAVNITKPQIMFCSITVLGKVVHLKKLAKCIRKIIVLDSTEKANGHATLNDLAYIEANFEHKGFGQIDVNPKEQVALMMCSSGTTGLPKAVMITQRNIQVILQQRQEPLLVKQCPLGTATVCVVPFFHVAGFMFTLGDLNVGNKVVFLKHFEPKLYLETIQKFKCKSLFMVPPLLIFLAKHPQVENYDLSHVDDIVSGAASLSKEIEDAVKKRLNISSVRQLYGMTETTMTVVGVPLNCKKKPGSSGIVLPYTTAKVRDLETHETLGPDQVGELCFKGDLVTKGYVGNKQASKDMMDNDGFLCTGDVGYYDTDRYFYIVDRVKELIKYKGYQVAPAELEALLTTHPVIQDAAVIGRPDTTAGELPLAFVVSKPGFNLTQREVQDFVRINVSHEKRLRGGVIFVNEIPRNPSGKILRRHLRENLQVYNSII